MQTPAKPSNLVLKRRHTDYKSITPRLQTRERIKTTYHQQSLSQIQSEKSKPISDSYTDYAELVVQSVKKNYMVGNIKPYAIDKSIFKELKMQVSKLKQVNPSMNGKSFYNQKQTIERKFNKLLESAINFKQKSQNARYKINSKVMDSNFVKSQIQDDLQNLIEDYREQSKLEKMNREKTISSINKQLIKNYPSLLQVEEDSNQNLKNPKNRFVKFKKQQRVARVYSSNDEVYKPKPINLKRKDKSYNEILDFQKEDYGIYSRSANKALYYDKKKQTEHEEDSEKVQKVIKMQKNFYRNYLGSYSQRKNILRRSEITIHVPNN